MEYATLKNGVKMPMEGFGVFQVPEADICEQAVLDAIRTGYRLIDTAAAYFNEEAVGAAIKKSGVPREEQPMSDYYGSWRAMEELYEAGKIRAIGVCNFYPERLADLCVNAGIKPMVNQVELHPFFAQDGALETMKEFEVQPEAWGPLAEGKHGIFTNEKLTAIAEKYRKSVAQVVLRWNVQRGVIVIPKSTHKERIEENLNIWDFTLSEEEMSAIGGLDLGHSEIIDHSAAETAKWLNGWKIHD